MVFGKKKQQYTEPDDEEDAEDAEDTDDETDSEQELPSPPEPKPKPSKQLTKEEIGALAEYHQARAIELLNIYRRI